MKTPREVLLSQHRHVEPKLERMWSTVAAVCDRRKSGEAGARRAPLQLLWRELIWPCRRIWAGLACTWVLIFALHLASSEPAPRVAVKSAPRSRDEMQALVEQRRMLAQMIESPSELNVRHKPNPPGPRSERRREFLSA
jgi:hypothetical protein